VPPPSADDERFTADRWVERDICDREPWPFADRQFDFVVCAQTLEDVRDPVWVCREMARVGRAGYVEVPSRLAEQAWWMQGPWAGWGHHHWLIDRAGDGLEFVFKPHVLHANRRAQLAARLVKRLPPEERNLCVWWEGDLPARERVFLDGAEMDDHLERLVRDRRDLARSGVRLPSPRDLAAVFSRRGSGGS
jgi:SAM-dependent methyltransferase